MKKRKHNQGRRVCNSLYHKWWFRLILIVAGMDLFVLGFGFALGLDILSFIPHTNIFFNFFIGLFDMLVASFIIHYAYDYHRFKKQYVFVCHYCANQNILKGDNIKSSLD